MPTGLCCVQMLLANTTAVASLRVTTEKDDGVHSVWTEARIAEAIASFLQCSYATAETQP